MDVPAAAKKARSHWYSTAPVPIIAACGPSCSSGIIVLVDLPSPRGGQFVRPDPVGTSFRIAIHMPSWRAGGAGWSPSPPERA